MLTDRHTTCNKYMSVNAQDMILIFKVTVSV